MQQTPFVINDPGLGAGIKHYALGLRGRFYRETLQSFS
jgi:hypothetical protein